MTNELLKAKAVTVGKEEIRITVAQDTSLSGRTTLVCTAVVRGVSHTAIMTVGTEIDYTLAQLQADLDAHCRRVATEAARRANVMSLLSGLC